MENKQIKEVEQIRAGYVAKETTKLDELKALNKKVSMPAKVFGYIFGSMGALVLGTGMCLAMKVIGDAMALGIVVGCVGILMCSVTYSIYKGILAKRKAKYADRILALSDELLNA